MFAPDCTDGFSAAFSPQSPCRLSRRPDRRNDSLVLSKRVYHATNPEPGPTVWCVVLDAWLRRGPLGGGIGWLMRKYGLTIDQLLAVDMVTAGGEFMKASADENADLFWGVRGGGGNFGIVTEFEFRLNALGPIVLAGPIFWRM